MNNQRGQLTLEFMLAIILIVTVSTLLGILTFTLSMTEVLQYVTFAGARSYFAADKNLADQEEAGNNKANELLHSLPFLMGAEKNQWIVVSENRSGDFSKYRESINVTPQKSQFYGYQLKLVVPILNIQIPFIKDVITPPEGSQNFGATVSSFLTREPTFDECKEFLTNAYSNLIGRGNYTLGRDGKPAVIIDNGC